MAKFTTIAIPIMLVLLVTLVSARNMPNTQLMTNGEQAIGLNDEKHLHLGLGGFGGLGAGIGLGGLNGFAGAAGGAGLGLGKGIEGIGGGLGGLGGGIGGVAP